jgi:predicted transcriptional regulator
MEEQEELAAALDDFTAGRVIEHDAMKAWIKDRLCSLKVKSKIA